MSLADPARDLARLFDMLRFAERAIRHLEGLDEPRFMADEMAQDAVIRAVSVVGEAAYRISAATRAAHPDLPWALIVGMRHRLVHDYGGIRLERLWATVKQDLPTLVALLRPRLPPPP
jgi:uncharacterized protein with HEPN domain